MKVSDLISNLTKLHNAGFKGEVFLGDSKRKGAGDFNITVDGDSDIILSKIITETEYESVDMKKKYPRFGRRVIHYEPDVDLVFNTRLITKKRYLCTHITTFDLDPYTITCTSKARDDTTNYKCVIYGNVIYVLLFEDENDYAKSGKIELNITFRYRDD